jgi:hypothetical protein
VASELTEPGIELGKIRRFFFGRMEDFCGLHARVSVRELVHLRGQQGSMKREKSDLRSLLLVVVEQAGLVGNLFVSPNIESVPAGRMTRPCANLSSPLKESLIFVGHIRPFSPQKLFIQRGPKTNQLVEVFFSLGSRNTSVDADKDPPKVGQNVSGQKLEDLACSRPSLESKIRGPVATCTRIITF